MKKEIILIIIFLINLNIVYAQNTSKVYKIDLSCDNGKISLLSLNLTNGYVPDNKNQPEDGYNISIISFSNKVLYSTKFEFPLRMFFDVFDNDTSESGNIQLSKANKTIIIPYFKNGKLIDVKNDSITVLSLDISKYAEICNNNKICESDENSENCSNDCPAEFKIEFLIIPAVILFLIFIIVLFFIKKKKSNSYLNPYFPTRGTNMKEPIDFFSNLPFNFLTTYISCK